MSTAPASPTLARRLLGGGTVTMLAVVLVVLLAVFSVFLGDRLFSGGAIQSMAFQMPALGILSLAMMITLLSGGLNLAIIATANLCALTMAWVLTTYIPGTESGGAAWIGVQVLAILAGLAVATIIGLVNGIVIAYGGVSPILATLGTMTLCKGISIGLTRGNVLSGFPEPIVALGNSTIHGVPIAMILFLALCIPMSLMLNRTPFGQIVYMIGSNERATRFSGVDTRRALVRVYVISSLLAAIAGLVMMATFNSANASYGESFLLVTILAAVLGGVDPFGGFGKVGGLVMALILLQVISSAFNLLNLSPFLTLAIWGALIIGVTALGILRHRFMIAKR